MIVDWKYTATFKDVSGVMNSVSGTIKMDNTPENQKAAAQTFSDLGTLLRSEISGMVVSFEPTER